MIISRKPNSFTDILAYLPILAIGIDLFTPFLIWKGILPAGIRWGSHLAVFLMIMISFLRMLVFDHIPRTFWLLPAISMLWTYVALANGQGLPATIWGLWLLFQFPSIALFFYLQPGHIKRLPSDLRKYGLVMLAIQVAFQLLQYVIGVKPGDDNSGLFGKNGTGSAVLFSIIICCVYFGYWITSKQWKGLIVALVLGSISSGFGEAKLFPIAMVAIGLLAILFYARKHRVPVTMLIYLIALFLLIIGFIYLYNSIVPEAGSTPIQSYLTNPDLLYSYLFRTARYNYQGTIYTDIGRGYAVQLGWDSIQKDPLTFLFGYGIGSRSESLSFGTVGVALTSGNLGPSVGTSLLVMIQEMGLIGLLSIGGLFLWIVTALIRDIMKKPDSLAVELRFALLLFSLLWPLWLWYATVWVMRVPMLLYWLGLGYVFAESYLPLDKKQNIIGV